MIKQGPEINFGEFADSGALEAERPAGVSDGAFQVPRPLQIDDPERARPVFYGHDIVPIGHIALKSGFDKDYPGPTGW